VYLTTVKDDPNGDQARRTWGEQGDDLKKGLPLVKDPAGAVTVAELVDLFLNAKKAKLDRGALSLETFADHYRTGARIVATFGKHRPAAGLTIRDFEKLHAVLAEGRGPVSLRDQIRRTRCLFRWAWEAGHLPTMPRFGPDFRAPSRSEFRRIRASKPRKLFTAEEIHKLLAHASAPMRLAILLGLCAGFGATDLARLNREHIVGEWVELNRSKTGAKRKAWLWPEVRDVLKEALEDRPTPKDEADADAVLVTRTGQRWSRVRPPSTTRAKSGSKGTRIDAVGQEFTKLVKLAGIGRGRGHYALRHTYRTLIDECGDPRAAMLTMGHCEDAEDMGSVYVEHISDERLRRISEHVRTWFLNGAPKGGK